MIEARLYDYLIHAVNRNLIITFDDGDQYDLAYVDLCYSTGFNGIREHEPLSVSFSNCKNASNKQKQALTEGKLKTPGVFWTTISPIEP